MAAVAADNDMDHLQAELANAAAQYQIAQQQATEAEQAGQLAAENERMIAFLQSEAMRQKQLDTSANGNAIEAIAATLANAARSQGDLNARNELLILQNKAAILVSHADGTVANALAQGRPEEIANAYAQSKFLHSLADTISGVLAETNMSNARIIADNEANAIHGPGIAEQSNAKALAAEALFAQDTALQAGKLGAYSVAVANNGKAAQILSHAAASLRNAEAMAAGG